MTSRQEVALSLRQAAAQIKDLSQVNVELEAKNKELLIKVASMENKEDQPALQKEAGSFSFNERSGFGQVDEGLPVIGTNLTAEQRLEMILNGESPSDYLD